MSDRVHHFPGGYILQHGATLQVACKSTVLEFSGEALVALLTAAQAAFCERKKPEHHSRGGRNAALGRKRVG